MMIGTMTVSSADQDLRGSPRIEAIRPATEGDKGEYRVTFRYRPKEGDPELADAVRAVFLAGSFNDWKMDQRQLAGPDAEGYFSTDLRLPAGRYEYKFVVNGRVWKADPGTSERTAEYGNSILMVR
jgi:hypothetical protein